MFGMIYIAVVIVIVMFRRSRAAMCALPALAGTVIMVQAGYPHAAAVSSGLWALSGLYLLINSEYVAGTLYGISGIIYVLFYIGFSSETLAIVPIVSDIAFGLGLVIGTWPSALALGGGNNRRGIRRTAVQIAREDLARSALPDRSKG